jgi:hypothetical protein
VHLREAHAPSDLALGQLVDQTQANDPALELAQALPVAGDDLALLDRDVGLVL